MASQNDTQIYVDSQDEVLEDPETMTAIEMHEELEKMSIVVSSWSVEDIKYNRPIIVEIDSLKLKMAFLMSILMAYGDMTSAVPPSSMANFDVCSEVYDELNTAIKELQQSDQKRRRLEAGDDDTCA